MYFPDITVRGRFAGTAGERVVLSATASSIEMIHGNGKIIRAFKKDNPDLFHGAASSFGTLGVTTVLEGKLIESSNYVALTYHLIFSIFEVQREIGKATISVSVNYLDCIMFAQDKGVICVGCLTKQVETGVRIQIFTQATDPWFYMQVQ